jgi:hypothetical protein
MADGKGALSDRARSRINHNLNTWQRLGLVVRPLLGTYKKQSAHVTPIPTG